MTEREIIDGINNGDIKAFKVQAKDYSEDLIILAYYFLKDQHKASYIVKKLLSDIQGNEILVTEPIYPFLANAIRTACGYRLPAPPPSPKASA